MEPLETSSIDGITHHLTWEYLCDKVDRKVKHSQACSRAIYYREVASVQNKHELTDLKLKLVEGLFFAVAHYNLFLVVNDNQLNGYLTFLKENTDVLMREEVETLALSKSDETSQRFFRARSRLLLTGEAHSWHAKALERCNECATKSGRPSIESVGIPHTSIGSEARSLPLNTVELNSLKEERRAVHPSYVRAVKEQSQNQIDLRDDRQGSKFHLE
jgi:hypothetical protein